MARIHSSHFFTYIFRGWEEKRGVSEELLHDNNDTGSGGSSVEERDPDAAPASATINR